jgi:hypothetical protein
MLLAVISNFYLLIFNISINSSYLFMFQINSENFNLIYNIYIENLPVFSQFSILYVLPFQVTGKTDGDGSFGISIIQKNKIKNKLISNTVLYYCSWC